jgi:hypothetical protein
MIPMQPEMAALGPSTKPAFAVWLLPSLKIGPPLSLIQARSGKRRQSGGRDRRELRIDREIYGVMAEQRLVIRGTG